MSTGIGGGVAIPHVRFDGVHRPTLGLGLSRSGIDFDALDGKPVHIVVMFAMPVDSEKEYLALLAQVMASLRTQELRETLLACATPAEVCSVLQDAAE